MQSIFNITSITPDYTNKLITIKTTFKVDPDTVNRKNVQVISASSGTTVLYKLSVSDDKIIVTLKDWPELDNYYVVKVDKIKDKLNRDLIHPISKDIYFSADTKLKALIESPNNNEAVKQQHNLVYFSIKQVNPDGSTSIHPMPEPNPPTPELPPESGENEGLPAKEAVLEDESDVTYHFEFASDIAFFDIVKDYQSKYTEGYIQLDNGQYYLRARVIQNGMNGDWSDITTFTVVPDVSECDNLLSEAKKEYLDDIMAPVEFFLEPDEMLNIVSRSNNGVTYPEFYIEFNKDIDAEKLPKNIIAYRRDL